MVENKLPSGVGKKIVEALKKQAEIEIQPLPDNTQSTLIHEPIQPVQEENIITDNISLENNFSEFAIEEETTPSVSNFDEKNFNIEENIQENNDFSETFSDISQNLNFEEEVTPMFDEKEMFAHTQAPIINNMNQQKNYSVPANVAVLKRLIMQLPQGVTKQTGAQIIRQTMEALGISMNSVLQEAQQGQDNLTANAKACLTQIAEYKNSIKSLEKQVQDYKKQAVALNDLISLFVMTDRH